MILHVILKRKQFKPNVCQVARGRRPTEIIDMFICSKEDFCFKFKLQL